MLRVCSDGKQKLESTIRHLGFHFQSRWWLCWGRSSYLDSIATRRLKFHRSSYTCAGWERECGAAERERLWLRVLRWLRPVELTPLLLKLVALLLGCLSSDNLVCRGCVSVVSLDTSSQGRYRVYWWGAAGVWSALSLQLPLQESVTDRR